MNLAVVAQLAVLVAALSYAMAGIFGRRFAGISPLVTAAGQLMGSTAIMLPLVLLVDRPWTLSMPGASTIAALLALALASTAAAYVIYFRILATAGASNLLLVTFLIPVSAVILGTGVLGEELASWQVIGMVLISLGLAAIDGRAVDYLRHRVGRGRVESEPVA
jgi:drug/metabolite transporter (DMT)-like permease